MVMEAGPQPPGSLLQIFCRFLGTENSRWRQGKEEFHKPVLYKAYLYVL